MIDTYGDVDFGSAWNFALQHFVGLLREQWVGLLVLAILDGIITVAGSKDPIFGNLAWFPLAAAGMRLFRRDFRLTPRLVIGLIGQSIIILAAVCIPGVIVFYLGSKFGGSWLGVALLAIVAVPIYCKFALAPYLYLFRSRDQASLVGTLGESWNAIGFNQGIVLIGLMAAAITCLVFLLLIPTMVLAFISTAIPIVGGGILQVIGDAASFVGVAFIIALLFSFTVQRIPKYAAPSLEHVVPTAFRSS